MIINNWNLYVDIKNSISAADTKLGIRIGISGLKMTIAMMVLLNFIYHWLVYVSIFILASSALQIFIASIGILPILGNEKIKNRKNENFKNKYYFGYIASFSNLEKYIEYLTKNGDDISNKDLIEQIYINSKILNRKYQLYKWSMFFWYIVTKVYRKIKNLKNEK